MNPSKIFIERPVATSLLMIALLLVGLLAYQLLPISALPEVEYPTIQIATFYPGASPDVTASSITAPLERQLGQMPGLNQMTSMSSSGTSMITLQFNLDMTLDIAEQQVQAAINAAGSYLPTDLPNPPIYSKVNPADAPILTIALTSKTIPISEIEDFADTRLVLKLSQISGVGLVTISAGAKPAVRVQINPTAVAALGLNLEDIRSAIENANINIAKGSLDGPRLSYTINANDQLITNEDYRSLIVAYKNGAPVFLRDIATIINSTENNKIATWMNTTRAVILNVQRQPSANVIDVVDNIQQILPTLTHSLPKAIDITTLTDRTLSIRSSIHEVKVEMLFSILLVIIVIFVFLRNLPATVIPSLSVPLSLVGSLALIYQFGFSLNNLTLMALTIATGFVIDDAIVMIENISRYIENGEPPLTAALKGAKQIGFTILSLSISLIAVLIPLLFMSDVIGLLFREFALTVAITIVISAVVSLTLTPMLCSRFLRHRTTAEMSRFERWSGDKLQALINRYDHSLLWVLRHQKLILQLTALLLLITGILVYLIPKGFFPEQDTGIIQGITEAPDVISFAAMANRQQELVNIILQDPAVDNVSSYVGVDGINATLNNGRVIITLKPLHQRNANAKEIINRLQDKLKQVIGISIYLQPIQNLSLDNRISRTQYQYSVSAANSDDVAHWSNLLVDKFKTLPMLSEVTQDGQSKGLQTFLHIDRDMAARFGITATQIDNTLYDAFGQRQVSTLYTQINQYHVILEALPTMQQRPLDLDNIYFNSINNETVPLNLITKITQGTTPLTVNRQDQFPVTTISFNLAENASLGTAVSAINHAKKQLNVPNNIQTRYEGSAHIFQQSLANEGFLMLAAIIVVYVILGVLYESYIHPITILSTLPSASIGALLALLLTHHDLSIVALIGIILLVGIVMKNAIMMIDFALEQERFYAKSAEEAIYSACLLRFRPILMTTMASLLGAVPLAIGGGMGSELRNPLGIAIVGGLIISQLLTLYTTPVIYLAFDKLSKKSMLFWRRFFPPTNAPVESL